jgi:hypothetical protein
VAVEGGDQLCGRRSPGTPTGAALVAMTTSPQWQVASHLREAGLGGRLNIETTWIPALGPDR